VAARVTQRRQFRSASALFFNTIDARVGPHELNRTMPCTTMFRMPPFDAPDPPQCHAISFFKDDDQLCGDVAAFVADGLEQGQPALIVTTEPHRLGITRRLLDSGIGVEEATARGDLLLVDAEETLAALMHRGQVNSALYHDQVGSVLSGLLRDRPGPVRIFGDMVDLLWQRGDYDNAIRIELLSNELAILQPISVICGYSMGHFVKSASKLEVVTHLHGRVHDGTPGDTRDSR
jgi:hypothetical protein